MDEFLLNLSESTIYLLGDEELISLWEDAHKRTRVLQGFEGRAKAGQTKHFEYDGTPEGYRNSQFKVLNKRDQRSVLRNEKRAKKLEKAATSLTKPPTQQTLSKYTRAKKLADDGVTTVKGASQATDMVKRTIGVNKNPVAKIDGKEHNISHSNSEPLDIHEREHIRQGNLYRQKYGKQDLIRTQKNYGVKTLKGMAKGDTSKYFKDALEQSANRAGLGKQDNHRRLERILDRVHKGQFAQGSLKKGTKLINKLGKKTGTIYMPKGSKPVDDKDLPDWIKDIDKD